MNARSHSTVDVTIVVDILKEYGALEKTLEYHHEYYVERLLIMA